MSAPRQKQTPPGGVGHGSQRGHGSPDEALVEAVAQRTAAIVLEALGHRAPVPPPSLVDAATVADALGVDRSWVYEHADDLGVMRLGKGPKARLRFDLATATARYTGKSSQAPDEPAIVDDPQGPGRTRGARLPNRLPEPGSVLAIKPMRAGSERVA